MIERTQLVAWQQQAELDCVGLVVGVLVVRDGKLLSHRRAYDRKMFPGCWDIVGGHVEEGEDLWDALHREVMEETGWKVKDVMALGHNFEWPKGEKTMREYVFLVTVEGDGPPVLEEGKAVELAWIGPDETSKLLENRAAGDDATKRAYDACFGVLAAL
jgi:8-oxo-dGTP diphosphatase